MWIQPWFYDDSFLNQPLYKPGAAVNT